MASVTPVDLRHQGLPGAIAAYLLDAGEPVLVDPGPGSTFPRLADSLERLGVPVSDLGHVLLTHVHLDHGGAVGRLAAESSRLQVHVHEDGAPHLADPTGLVRSTRRTFGEAHDRLWGEALPVPADRIRAWRPGDPPPVGKVRPIPTPGHIAHHLAYHVEDEGLLFAGDALGIVLTPESPPHPATPAPAVDLAAWRETLDGLGRMDVGWSALTHFGLHDDLPGRAEAEREALDALEERVRRALRDGQEENDRERFREQMLRAQAAHLPEERVRRFFEIFDPAYDWDGVRFYLERRG